MFMEGREGEILEEICAHVVSKRKQGAESGRYDSFYRQGNGGLEK